MLEILSLVQRLYGDHPLLPQSKQGINEPNVVQFHIPIEVFVISSIAVSNRCAACNFYDVSGVMQELLTWSLPYKMQQLSS